MADETRASVISLHQIAPPPKRKKPKSSEPRPKAVRPRKKPPPRTSEPLDCDHLIPLDLVHAELEQVAARLPVRAATVAGSEMPVAARQLPRQNDAPAPSAEALAAAPPPAETAPPPASAPSRATPRLRVSSALLTIAALALAVVGMTMNGWFAHSLGSTDISGWLFLAIGVAADLVALTLPSAAARLWQQRQRATALAAWTVWLMTFAFAITAGIGFASVNIADVTTARAARLTPIAQVAQSALADAMAARDRECKGGVGKYCREREATVADRRQALDSALAAGAANADPQSAAAVKLVAWMSGGALHPTGDDFAMLRLVLLALLPQIGGILLMVSRSS